MYEQTSMFPEDQNQKCKGMLSETEAAMYLGVTCQTVRNYIRGGKLKAIKSGKHKSCMVSEQDLEEFAARQGKPKPVAQAEAGRYEKSESNSKNCYLCYQGKTPAKDIFSNAPSCNLNLVKKMHDDGFVDSVFKGDNLPIMNRLLEPLRGKVDLVYIDPPFGTNRDFIADSGKAAYSDKVTDEMFLEFLRKRLYFLYEFLSPSGSIYVHIDKKMGHYVRIIMDEIFGSSNYINEITRIKCNPKNFDRRAYGNISDSILFYSKNRGLNIWNDIAMELDSGEKARLFRKVDSSGRMYTTTPLHAPGETADGPTGQLWKGIAPPPGRHWRYSPKVLSELDAEGLIEWSPSGNPRKIIYADEHRGKKIQDVWDFKDKGKSYSRYPTQKNGEMLDLIIENSSNRESLVLDCFMGSGSAIVSAAKLGRKFIGVDYSEHAMEIAENALSKNNIKYNVYFAE